MFVYYFFFPWVCYLFSGMEWVCHYHSRVRGPLFLLFPSSKKFLDGHQLAVPSISIKNNKTKFDPAHPADSQIVTNYPREEASITY